MENKKLEWPKSEKPVKLSVLEGGVLDFVKNFGFPLKKFTIERGFPLLLAEKKMSHTAEN